MPTVRKRARQLPFQQGSVRKIGRQLSGRPACGCASQQVGGLQFQHYGLAGDTALFQPRDLFGQQRKCVTSSSYCQMSSNKDPAKHSWRSLRRVTVVDAARQVK
jgi:hypothetical protein